MTKPKEALTRQSAHTFLSNTLARRAFLQGGLSLGAVLLGEPGLQNIQNFTQAAVTTPVGIVVAFAGDDPYSLEEMGWLICDGRTLSKASYPELLNAIGTAHGSPAASAFCLPDLQGRFIRAVSYGQSRDPDATARVAPRRGGNSGDKVGSVQEHATAVPRNSFTASIHGLPESYHNGLSPDGANTDFAVSNFPSTDVPTTGGGDAESRPVNKYFYFLIKARSVSPIGNSAKLPVGAVIAFAGDSGETKAKGFMLCDGSSIDSTLTQFSQLSNVINTTSGGNSKPFIYVPDLRGYFLRGVVGQVPVDPDSLSRDFARPDLPDGQKGNQGPTIGSTQSYATALPKNPFVSSLSRLPDDGVHVWESAGSSTGKTNWNGVGNVQVAQGGGDKETRPINIAVDWFIRFDDTADEIPIGGVVAYAGDTPLDNDHWKPCHGGYLLNTQYSALYEVIGNTYGSDPVLGFRLPDYRGYFLRGRNRTLGLDQDMPNRPMGSEEQYATALPHKPFTTYIPRLPTDGAEEHDAVGSEHKVSNWPGGFTISTNTKGGDHETRPTNISLDFLIRVS